MSSEEDLNSTIVETEADIHQQNQDNTLEIRRLRSGLETTRSAKENSKLKNLIIDNKILDKKLVNLLDKFENQNCPSTSSNLASKTELFRSNLKNFKESGPRSLNKLESIMTEFGQVSQPQGNGEPSKHYSHDDSFVASSQHSSMIQLISNLIPIFNGDSTPNLVSDLQAFLNCCRQVKSCLGLDQEITFCQLILTKLRGNAYLAMQNCTFACYDEFEKLLRGHFLPRKTYIQVSNDLRQTRQYPTETLNSFLLRVKNLVAECKSAAQEQFPADAKALITDSELAALYAIKSGVCNPIIKQFVIMSKETSVNKLCETLIRIELETNSLVQYPIGLPFQNSNNYGMWPQTGMTQSFDQPFMQNNMHSNQNFIPNPPNNVQVKCNFCNKYNHTYQECRIRKNTPFCSICRAYGHDNTNCSKNQNKPKQRYENTNFRPSVMPTNSTRKQTRETKCDFCLRVGHSISNCFTKKRWDEKNNISNPKN